MIIFSNNTVDDYFQHQIARKITERDPKSTDTFWTVPKSFFDFLYKNSEAALKSGHVPLTKCKAQPSWLTKEHRQSDMDAFENNLMTGATLKGGGGQHIQIPNGFLARYADIFIHKEWKP